VARRERTRVTTREAAITREPDGIEIGPPKLTRFEKARVVGARALQISMGAPVLLDLKQDRLSPIDVALLELDEGVLPISIRRSLPDGTSQNIPLKWLLHPVEDEKKPRSKKEDE
jgi:DNA-directed RNA polymerases I, II, and III subunit RPABC2